MRSTTILALHSGAFDVEVHRRRVPKRQQVGQPYAWKVARQLRIGVAECRQIAVGRRKQHNIGWILSKIAGDVAIVDTAAAVEFQVHFVWKTPRYPAKARRTA